MFKSGCCCQVVFQIRMELQSTHVRIAQTSSRCQMLPPARMLLLLHPAPHLLHIMYQGIRPYHAPSASHEMTIAGCSSTSSACKETRS